MNNNKHQPRKDPIEKIRFWLIFGFIGVFVVIVLGIKMHKPIARSYNKTIERVRPSATNKAEAEANPEIFIEQERLLAIQRMKIEMVFVEGGTFTMGWHDEIEPRLENLSYVVRSRPAHQVTVSSFYIGKYEITQAQWEAVMGTTIRQQEDKARPPRSFSGIHGEGGNYPMYYVSWNEAQEFIRRLNAATGRNYRLPTEAEWEFAARGGNKSRGYLYSGGNNLDSVGWFNHNSGGAHPVGTKQPNELGIYDMSGNVQEWCHDWYQDGYPSSEQRDPTGPTSGSQKVHRGGGWRGLEVHCRLYFRWGVPSNYNNWQIGFRVAHSETKLLNN